MLALNRVTSTAELTQACGQNQMQVRVASKIQAQRTLSAFLRAEDVGDSIRERGEGNASLLLQSEEKECARCVVCSVSVRVVTPRIRTRGESPYILAR